MAAGKQYAVSMLLKADSRVGGPINSAIGHFNKLERKMAHMSRSVGLHKVSAAVHGLTGNFAQLGGMVRTSIAPLLGLGGAASVGGLLALTNQTAAARDEYAKFSARIGMTAERLQGLEYAAERNGASTSELRTGMRDLAKNIGEAANGTGEARSVFKALGIDLRDVNGKVKTSEQMFFELSEILPKIEDASVRVALAQKVMGEGGGKLINTLMQGRGEIERLIQEQERYGLLTNKVAAMSEAFVDSQTKVQRAFRGIGYSIVENFMPFAIPAMDQFADWIALNREFIGQNVGAFMTDMGQRLASVDWAGAFHGMGSFVHMSGQAIDFVGGFGNALLIGGAILAGPFLSSVAQTAWGVGKLVTSLSLATWNIGKFIVAQSVGAVVSFFQALRTGVGVMHALNFAMYANPVGVLIGGLVALGGVGVLLYNKFKPFRDMIDAIWQKIKALASAAGDWVQEKFGINISAFDNGDSPAVGGGPSVGFPPPSAPGIGGMSVAQAPTMGDLSAMVPMPQQTPASQDITVRLVGFPAGTEVDRQSDDGGLTSFKVVLDSGESTVGTY
jgi:hypothetical protein